LSTLHEQARNGGLDESTFEELWKESKVERILPELDSMIDESLDGTQRVRTIVADLKNFSNIDRAQIQQASLKDGLESTLNIVWNEIKYNSTVEREYEDIPPIFCNPQQLNQVFLNMLVNASHAIETGPGKIVLRTKRIDDERVAVEIADNGKGIDEAGLKKIFDPFYTTKEIGKGTGLGLSISYRIIKEHGGEIEVDSEVGKGTTFRIILPIEGPLSEEAE
jgi:two-component system NtrC family sensor kinase